MKADPRLLRLLGGEPLASLRKRLRQRFERAPMEDAVERIHINQLNAEEHAALASLLGRPTRFVRSMRVDVGLIDLALQRAGIATSLRDALEQIDGPIVHCASANYLAQTQWQGVIDGCTDAGLIQWLQAPARIGLLRRLSQQYPERAVKLCHRAEAVLRRLPAHGVPRSQLAAEVLGDAHALDGGQSTATLVLAVWRQMDTPIEGERARDVWAKAGVLVNELARPALFLNLPAAESQGWRAGEPTYVSLRLLLRSPPAWNVAGRLVYVCENPNLVAIAADVWGPDCAPLVCTDGMPAAAQRQLLSQLAQQGARLCYHGDFDWPGIHIANHIMREHGAQSWRFGAADYAAAVRSASGPGLPLNETAVDAVWDAALTTVMRETRLAIAEEALADTLMQDLGRR